MSEVTLFKNIHGRVNAALANGVTVSFIDGKFFTTDTRLENYLQRCAEHGEHGIYVDANEPTIDPNAATPEERMEKKLRAKILAELAEEGKLIDAGSSEQPKLVMTTSAQVAGGAESSLQSQALAEMKEATDVANVDADGQPVPAEGQEASPALSALERLKAASQS